MGRAPLSGWNRHRFWIVVGLFAFLNMGAWLWVRHEWLSIPYPRVRIGGVLPQGEALEADRFVLIFNDDVVAGTSLEQPLPHAPFQVTPEVPGHWTWAKPGQLEYRLDEPLPAGRQWQVNATENTNALLRRTIVGETKFSFHTGHLRLLDTAVVTHDPDTVTFAVRFNQEVAPEALAKYVEIRDSLSRAQLTPEVITFGPSKQLSLVVPRRTEVRDFTLAIREGLTGNGGELGLEERIQTTLALESRLQLRRARANAPSLDGWAQVSVEFTSWLDNEQELPEIQIEPSVQGVHASVSYGSLRVRGQFESGQNYRLTLPATVRSRSGSRLERPQSVRFEVPHPRPTVRLPAQQGILSPYGNLELPVEVVNVQSLDLTASRVHVNNLVAYLHQPHRQSWTGREVLRDSFPIDSVPHEPQTALLDLRELVGSRPGIYRLEARASQRRWSRRHALVTISDLGISCKHTAEGLTVWTTSIHHGRPLIGVQVRALTQGNQELARGVTDLDGCASLTIPANHPDGAPWVVVASYGEDLNYLLPGRRPWNLSQEDTRGRQHPDNYDVFLYSERGVYRPGDLLHFTGIVREASGQIPPDFPLEVKVYRPDGDPVSTMILRTPDSPATAATEQGMFHFTFESAADDPVGRYRFVARLPGADQILGEATALIEAFVPVRFEVSCTPTQEFYRPDEKPEVEVSARYLFGNPAQLPAKVRVQTMPGTLSFPRGTRLGGADLGEYRFGAATPTIKPRDLEPYNLDAEGLARVVVPLQATAPGLWRCDVTATVTEAGGRSVSAKTSLEYDTAGVHLGLRGAQTVATGKPFALSWVAVDTQGQGVVVPELRAELLRVETDWVCEVVDHRRVWKKRVEKIPARKLSVPGAASHGELTLGDLDVGSYALRVRVPGSDRNAGSGTTEWTFRVRGREGIASTAIDLDHPTRVSLELDRADYSPGATARLTLRSPFTGLAWITVESDRVLWQRVLPLDTLDRELEVPVPSQVRGGAFVAVSVVRAVEPSNQEWLPHRAWGLIRLSTKHDVASPEITLQAPERMQPGTSLPVALECPGSNPKGPAGVAHIWAVDEGILASSAFVTPNPFDHYFGARRLDVTTADAYDSLLSDITHPETMLRIGGDGPYARERLRTSPVPLRQREPVVLWRKTVPVPTDGRVTTSLDVPDYTGALRVMAVWVSGDRYASTEAEVRVTSPLLVEPSWPRFAAPGDTFTVPLKVFNNTDEAVSCSVSLSATGPIEIDHGAEPWSIPANATHVRNVTVRAISPGAVTITTHATAGDLHAQSIAEFAVRPVTTVERRAEFVRVTAGTTHEVQPNSELLPGTTYTTVAVSALPTVELRTAVDVLIDYPYGCLEQTSSRVAAMIHAPELLAADAELDRADGVREMVQAGIIRILRLQLRSGGFSYWPGAGNANLWATAYASEVLTEAKRAGYVVPQDRTEQLCQYLREQLRVGVSDLDLQAHICFTLAAWDAVDIAWLETLQERRDKLDMEGQAQLALAWLRLGDKQRAAKVIATSQLRDGIAVTSGGRISSPVRQEAQLLTALLEIDPTHTWIPTLVERIEAARSSRGVWRSTLENASALSALVRYQRFQATGPKAEFEGQLITPDGQSLPFSHEAVTSWELAPPAQKIEVQSQGTGDLYVSTAYEGLALGGNTSPYDRDLEVRRAWRDASGNVLDAEAVLQVGDLIHVEVELRSQGEIVHNVAIVDALPGGCEVENPRLATSAVTEDRSAAADRVEFLDDRVVLFSSAGLRTRSFHYAIRVTTAGSFAVPPVQASCMYDATIASLSGGGRIEVE